MENASKALIIAATTFLALLIFASMVFLFTAGAKANQNYDYKQIQNNLEFYNSKFTQYNRINNTIGDVISVCNMAYDVNTDAEYSPAYAIKISVKLSNNCIFYIPNEVGTNIKKKTLLKENFSSEIKMTELMQNKLDNSGVFGGIGTSYDNETTLVSTSPGEVEAISGSGDSEAKAEVIVYKYLFKCVEIKYKENGRIDSMKFECWKNDKSVYPYYIY